MGRPSLDEARDRVERLEELVEQVVRRSRPMPTPRPSMPPPESEAPEIGDPLPERW